MKTTQGAINRYSRIILCSLAFWFGQLQMFGFSVGDRVKTSGTVNVRSTAAGTMIGSQNSGIQGTVTGGPTVATLGGTSYTWYYINFDSGTDGWVADIGLISVANQPPTHGVASQVRADTAAVIADPNGTIPSGVGVYFRVTPTDPDGDTVRMEVELHQLPSSFSGTANYVSSYVTSGSVATTATATGLAAGNYGWRYRVVDSGGHAGAWVTENNPDFIVQAANQPPTHGIASQVRADTAAVVADPNGTIPSGVGVYFRVTPTDPDGDTVRMEVELHQLPSSFSGTANYVSSYVTSGSVATTATATGLAAGNYGWRYRVVDSGGHAGAWVTENNPDFIVQAANQPPTHGIASQVRADTAAVIADPNGTIPSGVGVYFRVTPTDPDGDTVRMEVELHQLPSSFSGTANYVSSYVTSGSIATTATATGLPAGNYGWRYRVVDSLGNAGTWVTENNPDFTVVIVDQPPTHGIASQVRADTAAVIADPSGTIPAGVGVFFRVTPTDPQGHTVRMEVELHQLPSSFSGTANFVSPYVASGTVATTTAASGLAVGNYGWRYRVVSGGGLAGAWVTENNPDFIVQPVVNQPPTHGIASQVRADTSAVVADPNGTVPQGVGVYFRVTPTDPESDTARMEVELHILPAVFSGTPNYVSPYVASGSSATTATATGLTPGNYGWRYRVVDNGGHAGNWVNENNPDFIVQKTGGGSFYLSFPLTYNGWTPNSAQITTVFDHAMGSRYYPGGGVISYKDERGTVIDPNEPPVSFGHGLLYSYQKNDHSAFHVNGNYVGTQGPSGTGSTTLNYDGHSGYDYPVPVGTDVFAAADGEVVIANSLNDTGAGNYVRIQHGNSGYQSQYLHLSQVSISQGAQVMRGQPIGKSGNTAGPGSSVSPHLHFEVKQGYGESAIPVDPYGWEGAGADPYTAAASVNLWNSTPAVNHVPTYTLANHYRTDTGAAIPLNGGVVPFGVGVNFKAIVNDADGDTIKFEVELHQLPTIFTGVATHSSGFVSSGSEATTIMASGLTAGNYGWKFRVVDSRGGARAWSSVGNPDFVVQQSGGGNDRIYGVDVSAFQGSITASQWTQLKNQSKTFAWIRATKGAAESAGDCQFIDPKFSANIGAAKGAGLIVGAYHVGNVVQYAAVDEADFFVNVAGDNIKPGNLRPILDLEPHSCGDPGSLGVAGLSTWVDQWMTEVKRLTGVTPIIYCNQTYLPNLDSNLAQKYDLWVAKFTEDPESVVSVTPWNSWTAFQYTQNGSLAEINPLDLDVFYGTPQDFQSRLVISTPVFTGVGGGSVIEPANNGQFQFEVHCTQEQVTLQACDDLIKWTDVGTVTTVNGKAVFTDTTADDHTERFYRPKP